MIRLITLPATTASIRHEFASLIDTDVADVTYLFNLSTDRTVSGEEAMVADPTVDIDARDAMVIRPSGHRFTEQIVLAALAGVAVITAATISAIPRMSCSRPVI